MPEDRKPVPIALADCFASIQTNANALKGFGRGLGASNTFATSDYANQLKAVREGLNTAISTLNPSLSPADQKEIDDKMTTLEQKVKEHYNGWVEGKPYEEKAWEGLFTDVNNKLASVAAGGPEQKAFADKQQAELKAIQDEKQLKAVQTLERSLESQHKTNHSLKLSHDIAKNLYQLDVSSMFVPILNFDEKKLDDEMMGVSHGIYHGADQNVAGDEFRKRVKKFIESPRKLYTSEKFMDAKGEKIVYERTRDGGWWPRPPLREKGDNDEAAYKKYKHAYEGAFMASNIYDKQQIWIFSIHDSASGPNGTHAIQKAADVKIKILSVFEAAQKVNAERGTTLQVELDDETRNHLAYLKKTHPSDKEMIKHIDAILAIELEMLKTVERQKLIGKDAKGHMQALVDKDAKLDVPIPTGAASPLKEQFDALAAGMPEEEKMRQLGRDNNTWLYTTPAAQAPGATALQLDEIKTHLAELQSRISNATSAGSVMVTMLDKFKKEATAQPDAPELQPTSDQMKKLEALQVRNGKYLEDLRLRAGIFVQALTDMGTADPAVQTQKTGLLDTAKKQQAAIQGLVTRNDELASVTLPAYKTHQENALQQFQQNRVKGP